MSDSYTESWKKKSAVLIFILAFFSTASKAERIDKTPIQDPHYTSAGFFDIHVCNWPKRPLFFLTLFSTVKYKSIASIDIYTPDNKKLGSLSFNKFRLVKTKDKKDKKVFLKQLEIPKDAGNGWYTAKVKLLNGKIIIAKDYVIIDSLARASGTTPVADANNIKLPEKLSWEKINGAKYYKVFIFDHWAGGEKILESKLLTKPFLKLPKGLLEKGGIYSWRIHSRGVNEHVQLGDFNIGSLTEKMKFSIAD